jgi:hypothetical protein
VVRPQVQADWGEFGDEGCAAQHCATLVIQLNIHTSVVILRWVVILCFTPCSASVHIYRCL